MNNNYECRLAEIFQSGMMFQRDKKIVLWGDAAPDMTVSAALFRGGCARDTASGTGQFSDNYSVQSSCDCSPQFSDVSPESLSPQPILSAECKADADGHFFVALPPREAGEGYRLTVAFRLSDCGDNSEIFAGDIGENTLKVPQNLSKATSEYVRTIVLEDICFGDLWLAGGQSNMEFFLKYDRDWETTKKLPRNPNIRMYNVPQRAFEGHTTHNKAGYGYWFDDSDMQALECFSAPAYSFARNIQPEIDVPVGLIGCNWGGSTASAWVPEEVLDAPPLDTYLKEYEEAVAGISSEKLTADSLSAWAFEDSARHGKDFEPLLYGRDREWQLQYMKDHAGEPVIPVGPYNMNRPAGLYHTMLSSLIPFSIKGVLWYQGESDAGEYAFMYDRLLTALIACWREKWHDNFPFLIVQLAPFGVWLDCDNKGYTVVREKQALVAGKVPDVFMTSIMDLGSYHDIHPKEKMEVGRRLALLARGHVYGEENLLCDAPAAESAVLDENGRIVVRFRHGDGLALGDKPSDWKICLQSAGTGFHETEYDGNVISQEQHSQRCVELTSGSLQTDEAPGQQRPGNRRFPESAAADYRTGQTINIRPAEVTADGDCIMLTLPDSVLNHQDTSSHLCPDGQAVSAVFTSDSQDISAVSGLDGQDSLSELIRSHQLSLSVSLGWDDYAEIYVHNSAGLSAAPFHIDVVPQVSASEVL